MRNTVYNLLFVVCCFSGKGKSASIFADRGSEIVTGNLQAPVTGKAVHLTPGFTTRPTEIATLTG